MCTSKAEGGQRCFGHALKKMTHLETKYAKAFLAAKAAKAAGDPTFPKLKAKSLKLFAKLDDARAQYASTPQGEADLRAKMITALHPNPRPHQRTMPALDGMDLDLIIHRGRQIRERNQGVRHMVAEAQGWKPAQVKTNNRPTMGYAGVAVRAVPMDYAATPLPARAGGTQVQHSPVAALTLRKPNKGVPMGYARVVTAS